MALQKELTVNPDYPHEIVRSHQPHAPERRRYQQPPPVNAAGRRMIKLTEKEAAMLEGKSPKQRAEWLKAMPFHEYMRRLSTSELKSE